MGSHRVGHDLKGLTCMHALEKEMATHSSVLAWRIPGSEEPGGLPSMGSHRVGHDLKGLSSSSSSSTHILKCCFELGFQYLKKQLIITMLSASLSLG